MKRAPASPKVTLAGRLARGDAKTLGATNAVAADVLGHSADLTELVAALDVANPRVRHRAANALKKVQRANPALLQPFAKQILRAAQSESEMRARWNLMELLGALEWKGREHSLVLDLLFDSLTSSSAILRTIAMQALATQALTAKTTHDPTLRPRVQRIVEAALEDPSAAVRARARKLAKMLKHPAR